MPEIYADWKSLEPLTDPVRAGTMCVIIEKSSNDLFELGEIVMIQENSDVPECTNSNGISDYIIINYLALLPVDFQAGLKAVLTPARCQALRKMVLAIPLGLPGELSDVSLSRALASLFGSHPFFETPTHIQDKVESIADTIVYKVVSELGAVTSTENKPKA